MEPVLLRVNGAEHTVDAAPWESLLFVLRERLGLTGAKGACEQGECGSCSVLVDGELVCACLVLAGTVAGQAITTVEGLASGEGLSAVQQAFVDAGAVQCGYCTPGFVVAVTALLADDTAPDRETVREALAGNLCRCTGYGTILKAVEQAIAGGFGGGTEGSPPKR